MLSELKTLAGVRDENSENTHSLGLMATAAGLTMACEHRGVSILLHLGGLGVCSSS
jgi:hypothetical protein